MRARWIGKNLDIGLLCDHIDAFLNSKGFKARKSASNEGYVVSGSYENSGREGVIVRILGQSNDFEVDFLAGEGARYSYKLWFLTTLLGGGSLLLKSLKSKEALEKLEREFWIFVEDTIAHLAQLQTKQAH